MKNTRTFIYGISMALLLSGSSSAWAAAARSELPSPDKKFVEHAMEGGRAEIQLGQVAADKATSPEVREFGTRMVQDHSTANEQLTKILAQQGYTEPAPTEKSAKMAEKFERMNATDFDRAYMHDMVKDHKKDIAEFKKEAADGQDVQIKEWAAHTLPTLEKHLHLAQQTQSSLPK